jgi:hypothetical protein
MIQPVLKNLHADDFVAAFSYIATPAALYRALQRTREVNDVRLAPASCEISEAMVRAFVDALLSDLKPGEPFQHDLAISALAVALERRGTDFADEYLAHLARLELSEMSMSIRVARECLKNRGSVAKTTTAEKRLDVPRELVAMAYEELAWQYPATGTAQSREKFVCKV